MAKEKPLFAVDVGNTRVKVCFWATPDYRSFQQKKRSCVPLCDDETSDSSPLCDGVIEWLARSSKISDNSSIWFISSVNYRKSDELERRVRAIRPKDVFVNLALSDIPIKVKYDVPSRLGLDRAIAAFSAVSRLDNGVPFLVVDVGTAATIDYVDARGVFCGGAILPGPRLTAEALNAKTFQLPLLVDPENMETSDCCNRSSGRALDYPATETQGAIRLGVVYTLVGAIMSFFWKTRRRIILERENPDCLALVLAGGDAESIRDSLSAGFCDLSDNLNVEVPTPHIFVEPRLVLNGLFRIAALRSFEKSEKTDVSLGTAKDVNGDS